MKIAIAQIKPGKGDIQKNIEIHKKWIEHAVHENADFITFPELSLTAYEPDLAKELALDQNDSRLDEFQNISDANHISIAVGLPSQSASGIRISMVLFQAQQARKTYSKQILHADELPYFTAGTEQLIFSIGEENIAPAICYESLQDGHSENAKKLGATVYLASVAKPQGGIEKAFAHYPRIARKFGMPVLMSNSIGFCDNFLSTGQSAIWNKNGELLAKLESDTEGLLVFDTVSGEVVIKETRL